MYQVQGGPGTGIRAVFDRVRGLSMLLDRLAHRVKLQLSQSSSVWFVVFAVSAAFLTYFSMYAFRKPFSVGLYEDSMLWGIDLKILLILSQVSGYMLSKFIGIKVVSEMLHDRRGIAILGLVAMAEIALVLFAILPEPMKPLAMFLNGLPLGMIWGLVFSYLEGRKTSELLGAGLSASFIVASGAVKSVGKGLIVYLGVPEFWMPALTGLIFMPLLLVSVYALSMVPEPDADDIAQRQLRQPMNAADRWHLFRQYWFGIVVLILAYILFTGLRDFRDNFSAEIWVALGYGNEPAIFSYTGARVTAIVLGVLALLMLVKDNFRALAANHLVIVGGCGLLGASTWAFEQGSLDARTWMVMVGTGLYLAYIPYGCFLFDRLVAVAGGVANAGFLIYLADSAGYVGSFALLLLKHFHLPDISWLSFFLGSIYTAAIMGGFLVLASWCYFRLRLSGGRTPNKAVRRHERPPAARTSLSNMSPVPGVQSHSQHGR